MINCDKCGSLCCRYIATEIDKPDSIEEIQNIRWFLLHKKVKICIDDDGKWYVEFETDCRWLNADNKCRHYSERPNICREHSLEECEMNGEGKAYDVVFSNLEEFEEYVSKDKKLSKITSTA